MKITCPACKKASQTGDKCLRCGCDLSILRQIREAATYERLQHMNWEEPQGS